MVTYDYDIETLKYYISLLIECVEGDNFPLNKFILNNKLKKQDVDSIFSIFEQFNGDITELKNEVIKHVNLNYHQLDSLIISLYKERRFEEACYKYAKDFGSTASVGLIKIVKDYEANENI